MQWKQHWLRHSNQVDSISLNYKKGHGLRVLF